MLKVSHGVNTHGDAPKTPRNAFGGTDDKSHGHEQRTQQSATARHWERIYLSALFAPPK